MIAPTETVLSGAALVSAACIATSGHTTHTLEILTDLLIVYVQLYMYYSNTTYVIVVVIWII